MIMAEFYLDADNQIVGRLASGLAKTLLKGDVVFIINAEKAVISGRPRATIDHYTTKAERGDAYHGPFYPSQPDRMLKRIVRGMLPKNPKGRAALKRLTVYLSKPGKLENKKFTKPKASENNLSGKFISLSEICSEITGKKY